MQIFNLDISRKGIPPVLIVKQGDVGRKFKVILSDGGAAYTVPEGAVFSVWFAGSSGTGNYSAIEDRPAVIVDGNVATVEVIAQMITNAGGGNLCLVLNAVDGSQIGLWDIAYIVEAVPGMGSEAAEQYYTALSENAAKAAASAAEAKHAAATFSTDETLTQSGRAADAAAVGQKNSELENQVAVERARVNELAAMRGESGELTFDYEGYDGKFSIRSNGTYAIISGELDVSLAPDGELTESKIKIPDAFKPLSGSVLLIDDEYLSVYLKVEDAAPYDAYLWISAKVNLHYKYVSISGEYATSEAYITELADCRVGYDGTTYETAGEAVRTQLNGKLTAHKFVNLYDKDSTENEDGGYYTATTGVFEWKVSANHRETHFIPCKPQTAYSFSAWVTSAFSGWHVGYFDEDKNYIKGVSNGGGHTYITTPANAYYFRVGISSTYFDKLSIVEGKVSPPHYLPYNQEAVGTTVKPCFNDLVVYGESLSTKLTDMGGALGDLQAETETLKGQVEELQTAVEELQTGTEDTDSPSGVTLPLNISGIYTSAASTDFFPNLAALYTAYDQFLTQKNVTKKVIGYGSKADGAEDTTLPIYAYTISNPISGDIKDCPKVLLTSGIHADEKTAIMGLYNFVASLFDSTNENGTALRNALTFEVVPCINPWGYDNTTTNNEGRLNARGVNINRNFGNNWESKTDTDKGSAPYSELETQALKAWIEDNADALLHIDCHNHNYPRETHIFYMASDSDKQKKIFSGTLRKIMPHVNTAFGVDLSTRSHFVERNTIPGVCAESYVFHNIDGGIIETPYQTAYGGTCADGGFITPTADVIGNYLIEAIRNIKY